MTTDSLIQELESQKFAHGEDLKPYNDAVSDCIAIVRRYYEGKPAIPGKPVELQTRLELLAHVRSLNKVTERVQETAENEHMGDALVPAARGAVTESGVCAPSSTKCTACSDYGGRCPEHAKQREISVVDDDFSDEKLRDILRAHLDGVYLMSRRAMCDRLVSVLAKRYLATREPVSGDVLDKCAQLVEGHMHGQGYGRFTSIQAKRLAQAILESHVKWQSEYQGVGHGD